MKTRCFLNIEIPDSTRRALKAKAASEGKSIRALVAPLLNQIISPTLADAPQPAAPHLTPQQDRALP